MYSISIVPAKVRRSKIIVKDLNTIITLIIMVVMEIINSCYSIKMGLILGFPPQCKILRNPIDPAPSEFSRSIFSQGNEGIAGASLYHGAL